VENNTVEKRALIEIPEELWITTPPADVILGTVEADESVFDARVYAYTQLPWWCYGFNYCVTISQPIAHFNRPIKPTYKFHQQKIKTTNFKNLKRLPLRI